MRKIVNTVRNNELAKIHMTARSLGMNTNDKHPASDYRRMLWMVGHVYSSADLDQAGRQRVIAHLDNLTQGQGH